MISLIKDGNKKSESLITQLINSDDERLDDLWEKIDAKHITSMSDFINRQIYIETDEASGYYAGIIFKNRNVFDVLSEIEDLEDISESLNNDKDIIRRSNFKVTYDKDQMIVKISGLNAITVERVLRYEYEESSMALLKITTKDGYVTIVFQNSFEENFKLFVEAIIGSADYKAMMNDEDRSKKFHKIVNLMSNSDDMANMADTLSDITANKSIDEITEAIIKMEDEDDEFKHFAIVIRTMLAEIHTHVEDYADAIYNSLTDELKLAYSSNDVNITLEAIIGDESYANDDTSLAKTISAHSILISLISSLNEKEQDNRIPTREVIDTIIIDTLIKSNQELLDNMQHLDELKFLDCVATNKEIARLVNELPL